MIATYVQRGETVDFIAAADVAAGDVVPIGEIVGVCQRQVVAGEIGPLTVTGVFDFPKATGSGSGIAAGAKAYWDGSAKVITTTAASNKYVGKTVLAAGNNDETVRVRLSQ